MLHLFKPPVLASEEQTQRATMTHAIVWTTMIATTLTITMMAIVLPRNIVRTAVTVACVNTLGVVILLLNRRGRTREASILFVGGLLMLVAALAPTAGGIRAPAVTADIVIVLSAGLLLGSKAGIVTGAIAAAMGLGLVIAEAFGVLPAPQIAHTALSLWLVNILYIGIALGLQRVATGAVRRALDRAESELADRRQTAERLNVAKQRLQLALEAGGIGVWDWDLRTNQVVYDDRLFAMHGLSPTPDRVIRYEDWANQVHRDDLSQQEAALKRLATGQERRQNRHSVLHERRLREFRILRPDGTLRYVQSAAATVINEQGQAMRLVGMNIDVTEQKQAEREREKLVHDLGERVKELRLVHAVARLLQSDRPFNLDLLTELVALLPPAWQYPECCEARIAYRDMEVATHGWRESEWKQAASFAAAGGDGIIEVAYLIEKPSEAEGPFLAEERMLLESLTEMLEAYLEHRRASDALAHREAELRSIFEHAALGLALVGSDQHVVACNPALESFLGYTKDELAKMPFTGFTHPEDVAIDRELYRSLVAGERNHYQMEKRYIRKDGKVVWGLLTMSFVLGSSPQYAIGMVEDITAKKQADVEQKRLESQLRQSQKMQALGTLAGGIAHDFNNILTAIVGNAHLALNDLSPEHPAQISLTEIAKAGTRATELVRRILMFSRQQETQRVVTLLQPVIEEALKLLRASLPAMIHIRSSYSNDLPKVSVDATQIHQIVMNLGTNAAHAMGEKGGLLKVEVDHLMVDEDLASTTADLHQGRYVRVVLSDTGCGMTREIADRIFEPFFTTKGPKHGTGLGLSVVHGIIKNHEGAISVYSEPGKGTSFRMYFPIAESDATQEQTVATKTVRGHGERIMYVDDEELLVYLMTRMLERLDYEVSGYTDADQAIQAFRNDPSQFDAVVTDLAMPGMTGHELARALSTIRPDIPIVMTSGYIRDEDAEAALQAGVREVISKPHSVEDLGRVLHNTLERHLSGNKA
jgi:PAS domain S-box-containing protein